MKICLKKKGKKAKEKKAICLLFLLFCRFSLTEYFFSFDSFFYIFFSLFFHKHTAAECLYCGFLFVTFLSYYNLSIFSDSSIFHAFEISFPCRFLKALKNCTHTHKKRTRDTLTKRSRRKVRVGNKNNYINIELSEREREYCRNKECLCKLILFENRVDCIVAEGALIDIEQENEK